MKFWDRLSHNPTVGLIIAGGYYLWLRGVRKEAEAVKAAELERIKNENKGKAQANGPILEGDYVEL